MVKIKVNFFKEHIYTDINIYSLIFNYDTLLKAHLDVYGGAFNKIFSFQFLIPHGHINQLISEC